MGYMDTQRVHGLRRTRAEKGWTQRQLARRAGLSVETVRRGERGVPLRVLSMGALAEALGVSLETVAEWCDAGRRGKYVLE